MEIESETELETMSTKGLENNDMEFQNFLINYKAKTGDKKYEWWQGEFDRLLKATTAGTSLYGMFHSDSYDHWVVIDADFDDILFQLCMDFDIEFELAFALCEMERNSEGWKNCLEINED